MGRWLKKVQEAQGRAQTQPDSVSYVSTSPGGFAKNDPRPTSDPPGPAHDIDTIIEVLVRQVGRPLGGELESMMRQAMRPVSRIRRADMAAKIDDCFEYAESVQEGRQQVETLLRQGSLRTMYPAASATP